MNTDRIDTDDDGTDSEDRYAAFGLTDEDMVIYDRENPDAWIRARSPATVRL